MLQTKRFPRNVVNDSLKRFKKKRYPKNLKRICPFIPSRFLTYRFIRPNESSRKRGRKVRRRSRSRGLDLAGIMSRASGSKAKGTTSRLKRHGMKVTLTQTDLVTTESSLFHNSDGDIWESDSNTPSARTTGGLSQGRTVQEILMQDTQRNSDSSIVMHIPGLLLFPAWCAAYLFVCVCTHKIHAKYQNCPVSQSTVRALSLLDFCFSKWVLESAIDPAMSLPVCVCVCLCLPLALSASLSTYCR